MFTVGIPTYNRPRLFEAAFESCLRQTFPDFKVIVSDDSESGETRALAEKAASPKVQYFQHRPALGLIRKLNDFLVRAQTDWLVILCDDDLLHPEFLAAMAGHIRNHPDAKLFRSRYALIDAEGRTIRNDRPNAQVLSPFEFLNQIFLPEAESFKMNISGVVFPRKLLAEFGGFRNFHKGWHTDRLAWAQIGSRGPSICDERPLCSVRLHAGSITGTLEADYEPAIASTLQMKSACEQVLSELAAAAEAAGDSELVESAKRRLDAYTRRHLSRSIDHGLMSALLSKNGDSRLQTAQVRRRAQELGASLPGSARLYQLLSWLPQEARTPCLNWFRAYKQKKWNG